MRGFVGLGDQVLSFDDLFQVATLPQFLYRSKPSHTTLEQFNKEGRDGEAQADMVGNQDDGTAFAERARECGDELLGCMHIDSRKGVI